MALAPFIAGLGLRPQPVLLDLGPVIESNVRFFGEIGFKVVVEDLSSGIKRHLSGAAVEEWVAGLEQRLSRESDAVDGVLCWDIFDYLEPGPAQRLARHLGRLLKSEGALLAFFGTVDPRSTIRPMYTRHIVIDRGHLEYQARKTSVAKQRPWLNRDIKRLFEPLCMTELFLLDTHVREVLFCQPPGVGVDMLVAPPAGQ